MKWVAILLLCVSFCVESRASQDSTGIYVHAVLQPKGEEERSMALLRLVSLAEPLSYPFLEAISSSSLYVSGDKVVTVAGNSVYEVYPDQRRLAVSAEGLLRVEVSRADRLLLTPLS